MIVPNTFPTRTINLRQPEHYLFLCFEKSNFQVTLRTVPNQILSDVISYSLRLNGANQGSSFWFPFLRKEVPLSVSLRLKTRRNLSEMVR